MLPDIIFIRVQYPESLHSDNQEPCICVFTVLFNKCTVDELISENAVLAVLTNKFG